MTRRIIVLKAAEVVGQYASHNAVTAEELPDLITTVAETMLSLVAENPLVRPRPPVPISQSYNDEQIICLEDGKPVKLLKRYLAKHFDMTPEEYIEKWGLPEDYPFVAKSYSEQRSQIAKDQGLGKNP